MTFTLLANSHELWDNVKEYAATCSWSAGKSLARDMENDIFSQWERVIVACEKQEICGYCTVAKTDCIPNLSYTPYIGYVFVDERYRSHRVSQRMILFAMDYLQKLGFHEVYLVSDHDNFYEKYGFSVIDRALSPWGSVEKIYHQTF